MFGVILRLTVTWHHDMLTVFITKCFTSLKKADIFQLLTTSLNILQFRGIQPRTIVAQTQGNQ